MYGLDLAECLFGPHPMSWRKICNLIEGLADDEWTVERELAAQQLDLLYLNLKLLHDVNRGERVDPLPMWRLQRPGDNKTLQAEPKAETVKPADFMRRMQPKSKGG